MQLCRSFASGRKPQPFVRPFLTLSGSRSFSRTNPATPPAIALRSVYPTTTTTKGLLLLQPRKPQTTTRIPLSSPPRTRLYSHQSPPASASSSRPLPIMYEGKWTAQVVRQTFLEYFEQRGHTIGTIHSDRPHASFHRGILREVNLNSPRQNLIASVFANGNILQCHPALSSPTMTLPSCSPTPA